MRLLLMVAALVLAAAPDLATAQIKLNTKADPNAVETRYFTAIDGLMDGNADVILKETRQGKNVTAASLDLCYPAAKNADRKDRFVVPLTVSGQSLTGTTTSLIDKKPVTVKLTRKQNSDTYDFRGQITIGQTTTEVVSSENSDISEKEFQDSQTVDDGINATPKDFTEVSPESVGVRIKLDSALEFLKSLKGQDVEVALTQHDRDLRRTALGSPDPQPRGRSRPCRGADRQGQDCARRARGRMDHGPRRDGPRHPLSRGGLSRRRQGEPRQACLRDLGRAGEDTWRQARGRDLERRHRPAETGVEAAEPDLSGARAHRHGRGQRSRLTRQAGGSDQIMLWISTPTTTTADESSGAKLTLSADSGSDEEGDARDDSGIVEALTKELKGQRWDADKSVWK